MSSKLLLTIGMAAAVLTTGCVQKVTMKVLEPAEVASVASTKVIAVTNFKKDYGIGLSSKIEAEISKQILDGKPYFTLVDRETIGRVVQERHFQPSGIFNLKSSTKLGKLIGAQALISGEITSTSSYDSHFLEQHRVARDRLNPTASAHIIAVNCDKRVISMSASITIADVKRGAIAYADSLKKSKTYKHCSDDRKRIPSKDEGIQTLAQEIAKDFVFKLAPHYVYIEVELIEKIEFGVTDAENKSFETALNWIKENRYNKALDILDLLNKDLDGKSYAVLYNLGVLAEAQGRLAEAQKLYKNAEALVQQPVTAINVARTRIVEIMDKRKKALAQIAK